MICARQKLGMPDNCAICKVLHTTFYSPCRGEPDKVKIPVKQNKPETITIKKLSEEEAKEKIMEYIYIRGGKFHISEISENLRIDIEMVEKIIEEL